MEIMTTLQKIQEQQQKITDSFNGSNKSSNIQTKVEEVDPILQINRTLQYILDKLHSIDQIIRNNKSNYNYGNMYNHESEVEKSARRQMEERQRAIDSNISFL